MGLLRPATRTLPPLARRQLRDTHNLRFPQGERPYTNPYVDPSVRYQAALSGPEDEAAIRSMRETNWLGDFPEDVPPMTNDMGGRYLRAMLQMRENPENLLRPNYDELFRTFFEEDPQAAAILMALLERRRNAVPDEGF